MLCGMPSCLLPWRCAMVTGMRISNSVPPDSVPAVRSAHGGPLDATFAARQNFLWLRPYHVSSL